MNGTAYNLWARIKQQRKKKMGESKYIISLWGTSEEDSIPAAFQIQEMGLIEIIHINKYEMEYKFEELKRSGKL